MNRCDYCGATCEGQVCDGDCERRLVTERMIRELWCGPRRAPAAPPATRTLPREKD